MQPRCLTGGLGSPLAELVLSVAQMASSIARRQAVQPLRSGEQHPTSLVPHLTESNRVPADGHATTLGDGKSGAEAADCESDRWVA